MTTTKKKDNNQENYKQKNYNKENSRNITYRNHYSWYCRNRCG